MAAAFVIGDSGFAGRHTLEDLLEHGYRVTTLSRGRHGERVGEPPDVDHRTGDRSDADTLASVAESVEPDVVIDLAAFHPEDVRTATEVFADADAYVYVSSGSVYAVQDIPKREDDTPLREATAEQLADDTMASYPARKAACDREVVAAADRGIAAMTVRPSLIYGPKATASQSAAPPLEPPSWAGGRVVQTRHDYWVDRVNRYDRVVVPGDGTAIWHRAYVEDIASAFRVVAERGEPGEAYNAADRSVCTLGDIVDLIAEALDTSVEVVDAGRRELAEFGLEPGDFPFYHHPMTGYPHVLDTCKLASLGWESTPVAVAMARTVEESLASGRTGQEHGPDRDTEERLLAALA